MSGPRAVAVLAPAKINLWLEVLGRRPDGYHEIKTWMLAIDLCDRIEARVGEVPGIRLEMRGERTGSDVPADRANLAWRGAEEALAVAETASAGVELLLEKRIPSQAGLGGGSSDAAAAWLATAALLGIEPAAEVARARLQALGSDCVFFLDAASSGAARCEGRGERVHPEPAPRPPWWVAVLSPDLACPTASVYAALRRAPGGTPAVAELPERWFELPASAVRRLTFNRLEAAALVAVPRLRAWRELLGPGWGLSGSGSSFFALCDERGEAEVELARARAAADAAGLLLRGTWIGRPSGHGAKKLGLA